MSGSSGSSGSSSGTFTVSFDVNGGSGSVDSQTVDDGGHATKPATDPTTENKYKTFDFWSADGTTEYKFTEATVTADIELKAVWKDKYTVGGTGPAGGYIFYDAGESGMTSQYVDENNVTKTYTWRYLEAAPSDMTANNGGTVTNDIIFGYYRTSATSGTDLQVVSSNNTAVGTGRSNTRALVNAMGNAAYCGAHDSGGISTSSTTSNYAAKLCDDYWIEVGGVRYDDWFLPSTDELGYMYTNLHQQGKGSFATTGSSGVPEPQYLSSSETSASGAYSRQFMTNPIALYDCGREYARFVRACRAF